jgi:hypothetical protein
MVNDRRNANLKRPSHLTRRRCHGMQLAQQGAAAPGRISHARIRTREHESGRSPSVQYMWW